MTAPDEWRVIQLSDAHVSAAAETRYRGQDARAGFETMLAAARAWRPHLLLLTGDLAEDGSAQAYAWLSGALRATGVPCAALPGNHDDPDRLATTLGAGPWPAVVDGGHWRIVLLDSTVPGEPSGAFSPARLDALEALLRAEEGRPTLVALHHQPLPVESAWIDRFALGEGAPAFRRIVTRAPGVRAVTWGHIHSAFRRAADGRLWLGTPSTVSNSLPFVPAFTPDPGGPAARWFRLRGDGGFATGILRAGG